MNEPINVVMFKMTLWIEQTTKVLILLFSLTWTIVYVYMCRELPFKPISQLVHR